MQEIIVQLRYMQLYTHNAHNKASGPLFFQDHEFFGSLYPAYEKDYDDVVERAMGLGVALDLNAITIAAANMLAKCSYVDNKTCMKDILECEKMLCSKIKPELPKCSEGTKQLLGEICNQSEKRQYLLKQRIA